MMPGAPDRPARVTFLRAHTACALTLGLLFSPDIAAQQLIDERQSVREREQIEFQQRLRSLQRQTLQPVAPEGPIAPLQSPSGQCWWITGLRLSGNQLLPQSRIHAAAQAQVLPCMDATQINQLLAAITALYAQDGYIASRPQLLKPPQDQQPLEVAITEGFVESIELGDQSLPLSLRSAFGELLGRPLQLRTLERGLEQLNRLQSFDLTADIEPGTTQGASRIVIRPHSKPPRWALGVNLNNAGKPNIGRHQAQVSASFDSPLHLNDFIQISANQTLDAAPAMSRGASFYYSIPWQAWTLNLSASQAEYRIPLPTTQGQRLDTYGTSELLGAGLERALWRDQQRLLSAMLRLDHKTAEAFLGDKRLGIQSPRLLNAEAALNLLWVQQGIWTAYLGYTRGLSGWDGRDSLAAAQPGAPRGEFGKWRGSLGYLGVPPWVGQSWQWHSQLAWQYSNDPLPPIEQQLLTDEYAVRGLRDLSLSGNTAASWRNTLSLKLPLVAGWSLEPHLGVDLGWRRIERRHRNTPEPLADAPRLAGTSLGIALLDRHTRLSLSYQHSLYLQNAPTPPGYWRLELALKL
jgi:hemolysin activation/secretion protein